MFSHTVKASRALGASFWCAATLLLGGAALADEADLPGRVARVNYIEGSASLQLAGSSEWLDDVRDRPLMAGDKLWIGDRSRAEMHVGSIAFRMGENTAVAVRDVDDSGVRLGMTAGTLGVTVRSLSRDENVSVETPNGAVALIRPGVYRIDVSDNGDATEVTAFDGRALLSGDGRETRIDSGESARVTRGAEARVARAANRDGFDRWAEDRDRREANARSARYVSREVIGYSDLDDYGDWYNEPSYGGPVWYPRVDYGWAPYHYGRWIWAGAWGWTWIDDAPWGFAPCHYGRWVYMRHRWGWVPPSYYGNPRPYYAPALVAWIGGDGFSLSFSVGGPSNIGWFPLGYNEVYEPWHHHSRGYFGNVNRTNIIVNNTVINNYYNGWRDARPPDRRYANQHIPGALAAVSQEVFRNARPLKGHLLPVSENNPRIVPIGGRQLNIAPVNESVGRIVRADRPSAAPPQAIMRRFGGTGVVSGLPDRIERGDTPATADRRAIGDRPVRGDQGGFGRQVPNRPAVIERPTPKDQPVITDRPTRGERPIPRDDRPVQREQRPIMRDDRPAQREERPIIREDRPVLREQRPARREERPVIREDRPIQREQPPAREERAPSSDPRFTNDRPSQWDRMRAAPPVPAESLRHDIPMQRPVQIERPMRIERPVQVQPERRQSAPAYTPPPAYSPPPARDSRSNSGNDAPRPQGSSGAIGNRGGSGEDRRGRFNEQ